MRQKYAIIRDDEQKALIIREYAELDKEMMSLLCEESYPLDSMEAAVNAGTPDVIDAIRTNNMYPPTIFAQPIAEAIINLMGDSGSPSAELFFDDKDLFSKEPEVEEQPAEEEEVEEDVDVDDLLEEDSVDEDYDGENVITDLKSSIQVADDDSSDLDD
jgi:hypothetical protein